MPAIIEETVGARLRRLRQARGMSQRDLACDEVSAAHISRIELDGRAPSGKTLRILARRLRVRVTYLEFGLELTECEALELRLMRAALRVGLAGGDDERRGLLDALSEAEALDEPLLILDARLCLAYDALSRRDYESAGALLQSALESRATSLPLDRDLHGVLAAIHWELKANDPRSVGQDRTGSSGGVFSRDQLCDDRLEEIKRLEECAEAALREGKPLAALRALRAGILDLHGLARGWAESKTSAA